MKLLERYATVCGCKIGRQWVLESFYPLPTTRYITLHASSGMIAKNYPYYDDVVKLISHILHSQNIQIVQLGGKDDPVIEGCVNLLGQTDFHQSCYILKNSLLHLSNDTWSAHRVGELNVPLVELFGPTSISAHSPFRFNPEKTSFIESHRWGRNPSFASQEAPATISVIPPEKVANEILRLLSIEHVFPFQTRFQGALSKTISVDLIPNTIPSPSFLPEVPFNVKMDIVHNEEVLGQVLGTGRRVHLFTAKSIDLGLLNHFKAQILSYNHEVSWEKESDLPTHEYVAALRNTIPKSVFFTREMDEKKLSDLRFRYFDITDIQIVRDPTKDDYLAAALLYLNREDTPQNRVDLAGEATHNGGELQFRTSRFILSSGAIYLSYSHLAAKQGITSLGDNTGKVIDDPAFWKDANFYSLTFHPL